MSNRHRISFVAGIALLAGAPSLLGCSPEPEGLAPAAPADVTVKMDFFHKPLPDIPLPNDVATRYDEASPTKRRVNASLIAPTSFEALTRELIDQLDGWGVFQPISIPFTGPLDVDSVLAGHRDDDYDTSNDVIYLIDVDKKSPTYGQIQHLDIGNGNYPATLEKGEYWKNDPRGDSLTLAFEEADEDRNRNGRLDPGEDANGNGVLDPGEDANGNGKLDPPEDTDADGILDVPNYLPGKNPAKSDLAGRADALMTFYERSTNTLIVKPMVPLRERTTYAVVVTKRLKDANGESVGSPFPFINHEAQTEALTPLMDVLPKGLAIDDVAFAFTYTTQSVESQWKVIRDGVYGHGVQAHLNKDYPLDVELLPMRDPAHFPNMKNPYLMYGENWRPALELVLEQQFGLSSDSLQYQEHLHGVTYVDYMAVGQYQSPQLFRRTDDEGKPLPLNKQSWPADIETKAAPAVPETIYFTASVPRKESSVRGQGKPAPVVIWCHGYTGPRFDVTEVSAYLARHGLASIAIDGPSHGIGLTQFERTLIKGTLSQFGIEPAVDAFFKDRSFDQNGDGNTDSGADFWTAYLFHTRDIVRQFALDYMQLVRLIRSFDGKRRWATDVNGDGEEDLAGDFDGDGVVDIGGDAPIYMGGASLGGIMSTIMAGVEPGITAVSPISGGGGFGDIGIRSTQGGVREAFILRVMNPVYTATLDAATGSTLVETIVTDLNDAKTLPIASVKGLKPWDTMLIENLRSGERGCGYLNDQGTARAGLPSNQGDPTRITFYAGPQLDPTSEHCALFPGAKEIAKVESFEEGIEFQAQPISPGTPLTALQEGPGTPRAHSDLRRLQGLGQLVLDPADPAVVGRHALLDRIEYPGTGEKSGTHMLIITTMGDMAVPASSGLTAARATGIMPYLQRDPVHGKPLNQVVIDNYVAESVNTLKRFTNPKGEGVHIDIENFSEGGDMWGTDIPRIKTPLRAGMSQMDTLGGKSAAIFPYTVPEGQHGFDLPGAMTDKARQLCKDTCATPATEQNPDPCMCANKQAFDIGRFMMTMLSRYFASQGTALSADLCQSRGDCPGLPPQPEPRDPAKLE